MQFIEKHYPAPTREVIYSRISRPTCDLLGTLVKTAWYPREVTEEMWGAIASLHDEPEKRVLEVFQVGRFIGECAATTFLRLLLKLLTPPVFGRKFGEFWSRYESFGTWTANTAFTHEGKMDITVRGIEGYRFFLPCGAGWIHYAFEAMGKQGVKVEGEPPLTLDAVPEVVFKVSWS
jgi:hypothetical protein